MWHVLNPTEIRSETPTLKVDGDVDLEVCRRLKSCLDDLLAQGHLVIGLDLSQATYIGTNGVYLFLSTARELAAWGGSLLLISPSPTVRQTLQMAGLPH